MFCVWVPQNFLLEGCFLHCEVFGQHILRNHFCSRASRNIGLGYLVRVFLSEVRVKYVLGLETIPRDTRFLPALPPLVTRPTSPPHARRVRGWAAGRRILGHIDLLLPLEVKFTFGTTYLPSWKIECMGGNLRPLINDGYLKQ